MELSKEVANTLLAKELHWQRQFPKVRRCDAKEGRLWIVSFSDAGDPARSPGEGWAISAKDADDARLVVASFLLRDAMNESPTPVVEVERNSAPMNFLRANLTAVQADPNWGEANYCPCLLYTSPSPRD